MGRALLADAGPDAVTLRGIAAKLGMAPAGVHYYYSSRDKLLASLVIEGFDELARETAGASGRRRTRIRGWTEAALAYRAWAMSNAELFQLAHSAIATRLKDHPGLLDAKDRAVRALTDPLAGAIASGEVTLPTARPVSPRLRAHFRRWSDAAGVPRDPALLLYLLQAYTVVHGAVSLTITGSLPRELLRDDVLFRAQLAQIVNQAE